MSIRGPHGLGKTALAAITILWFALTRDGEDWKIPTTASAWRQLEKFLWPEIHKWARRLDWSKIPRDPFSGKELMTLSLRLSTGEAFALASDNPALIEGAHAEHLLYIFDESKVVPDPTWDSAEGAFSVGDAYWLAISTPGETQGRFYEIQMQRPGFEDWHVLHVTKDDVIAAGRMDPEWAENRRNQWGEDSSIYINRVLGDFCEMTENGVIPLSWVERSNEIWEASYDPFAPVHTIAVDVGGGTGGDSTIIAELCYGGCFRPLIEIKYVVNPDIATMEIVDRIAQVASAHSDTLRAIVVDAIGIGAGVAHRLRELGFPVVAFVANRKTEMRDKSGELGFANWRSAAWWVTRELLNPAENIRLGLPTDNFMAEEDLVGELTAPQSRIIGNGKIQVEAKDDIRKRLRRSTNRADAVIMALSGYALATETEDMNVVEEITYDPVHVIDY